MKCRKSATLYFLARFNFPLAPANCSWVSEDVLWFAWSYLLFLDNAVMTTPKRRILSFVFTVLCFEKAVAIYGMYFKLFNSISQNRMSAKHEFSLKSQLWVRPKFHSTQLNYHFMTPFDSQSKCQAKFWEKKKSCKTLGEGGGWWSKWKLRIENCVFATANSRLSNVNYGICIANYENGFCT